MKCSERYKLGSNSKILFLHIPKTAGVSVRSYLGQAFHVNEILHIEDPEDFCDSEKFQNIELSRLIYGHFHYNAINLDQTKYFTITFLRNPLKRIVSSYYFWKSLDPRKDAINKGASERIRLAKALPLEEFLLSDDPLIWGMSRNRQIKYLVPYQAKDPEVKCRLDSGMRPGDAILEVAIMRLERFNFVGITEMMSESLALLAYHLVWVPLRIPPRMNVTKGNGGDTPVSSQVKDKIMEQNRLDYALYEYAERLFHERYKVIDNIDLISHFEKVIHNNIIQAHNDVCFSGPILGQGWYEREYRNKVEEMVNNKAIEDKRTWFRWTGYAREASIYLKVYNQSNYKLIIYVTHILNKKSLKNLKIVVNDHHLNISIVEKSSNRFLVRGIVPWKWLQDIGFARIEIICGFRARPCSIFNNNMDERMLGIAVDRITLKEIG